MNYFVRKAIDLVRADAKASRVPRPPHIDEDWEFYADISSCSPELVVTVTDRLQGNIIERLWPGRATNWPECPAHPRSDPMRPIVVQGHAMWGCTDGTAYAPIGSLSSSPHQARRARERGK